MDPQHASQWPHFTLTNNRLYRVDQDPWTKELRTQLVMPMCHHRAVINLAQDVPMAGHLGHENTLVRILTQCFWSRVHQEVQSYCSRTGVSSEGYWT